MKKQQHIVEIVEQTDRLVERQPQHDTAIRVRVGGGGAVEPFVGGAVEARPAGAAEVSFARIFLKIMLGFGRFFFREMHFLFKSIHYLIMYEGYRNFATALVMVFGFSFVYLGWDFIYEMLLDPTNHTLALKLLNPVSIAAFVVGVLFGCYCAGLVNGRKRVWNLTPPPWWRPWRKNR